jgi:hypothetical protein
MVIFKVTSYSDISEKIIPFFNKYPILGVKFNEFEDFKKVANLMEKRLHLTPEGLDQIKKIKLGMNRKRVEF